jgi:hypothetical protein
MGLHFRRMLEADPGWIPSSLDDEYVLRFMRVLHEAKRYQPDASIMETKLKLYDPLRVAAGLPLFVGPWPEGLNQIKKYAAIEMATNIRNNVSVHFYSRVKKFVNFLHPELSKPELRRLIEAWWQSSHSNDHPPLFPRPDVLTGPPNGDASVEYSLKAAPELFISCMWYMLRVYETHNRTQPDPVKLFSLLPVRKGFRLHHIRIDTQTVEFWAKKSDAFADYSKIRDASLVQAREQNASSSNPRKRVSRCKAVTSAERQVLWEPLIRQRSLRGLGRFQFGYSFATDGFSVSILCDNPSTDPNLEPKRKRKRSSFGRTKFDPSGETRKEPVDPATLSQQSNAQLAIPSDGRKLVGVDPGKHSILYMTTDTASPELPPDKFERLEYTARQRRHDMKTSTFRKLLLDSKPENVKMLETQLSRSNSKTIDLVGFVSYLRTRFAGQNVLYDFYRNAIFAKRAFRSFQGRQRSEQQLVLNIEQKFGPRDWIALAIGNWSRKSQMRGCAPSPVVGMTNLLRKHFCVYVVDEFKTTKTCSKCGGEMKADPTRCRKEFQKTPYPNTFSESCRTRSCAKTGTIRSFENRSLRRCQNESCRALFSRDYNAAINILKQATHLRDHAAPHPWFKRTSKDGHPGTEPGTSVAL